MRRIVAINGQLNSGKDTAADRLVSRFGFAKIALADPIKRYGMNVFHFTETQLWGPSEFRNKLDSRFQYCSEEDGDDAWMAVFHRAEKYNTVFVQELFEDPRVRAKALRALDECLTALAKEHPQISPRIVLQILGTEWGRSVDPDVWLRTTLNMSERCIEEGLAYDKTLGLVKDAKHIPTGVVISDIRFNNELKRIKDHNGFLVKLVREETDNLAESVGIQHHPSEAEQKAFVDDDFDYIINNRGSLEDLIDAIDFLGVMLTGMRK